MSAPAPSRLLDCADDARRATIEAQGALQGIDYLEVVSADQRTLLVRFIPTTGGLPALLTALHADPAKVRILGGERVRDVGVASVTAGSGGMTVAVDRAGDFSTYTLRIDDPAMDPAYAEVDFSFKAGCPTRFDCRPRCDCPEPERAEPPIDYLAKDYASFRQALLDLLPTLVPDWRERHEADLMVTLVEVMSYVGDLISYEQDAVATEAYLETARRRVSVRRHARLVDYRMHDGASARAWVHLALRDAGDAGTVRAGTQVLTKLTVPIGAHALPHPPVLGFVRPEDRARAQATAAGVFETLEEVAVAQVLNRIPIHTWGDGACCLPAGSTSADLVGDLAFSAGDAARDDPWRLRPGSHVVFEEVAGPVTGLPADADPRRRQLVTLTGARRARDPLLGLNLTRITWDEADALTFPLCVSVVDEPGTPGRAVSVARGNLVLADHGATRLEDHPPDPPPAPGLAIRGPRAFRLTLDEGPLAQRLPVPPGTPAATLAAAPEPRDALPQVGVVLTTDPAPQPRWSPAPEGLLDRDGFARAFAVETEDDGRPTLRFGDDLYGMSPPDGARIEATYRVGVGAAGNVGGGALSHLLTTDPVPPLAEVRNPLPATGGLDPEPIARVKQLAPDAFRAVQERAVTEADYAAVAERHPAVGHARATFRWTGSWHTVFLNVDLRGGGELDAPLRRSILDWVTRFTQTGYDLELQDPIGVPLDLELFVCAARGHLRPDVEQAVLEALSSRPGRFFDPDHFSFGDPLFLSALYAAVEDVPGVDSVVATRFSRREDDDPPPSRPVTAVNVDAGLIAIGRLEVLRLDNDPSRPERGLLRMRTGGGA